MKKTVVVNILGSPGAGKSTGAAYVFAELKMRNINAELVTEYAKDKTWEGNMLPLQNQAYVFGKQSYRLARCDGKVDVIVTDSPIVLSAYYNNDPRLTENFNKSIFDLFNSYNNINFYLKRVKPYNTKGRNQSEAESDKMSCEIKQMLDDHNIEYIEEEGSREGYNRILETVLKFLETQK